MLSHLGLPFPSIRKHGRIFIFAVIILTLITLAFGDRETTAQKDVPEGESSSSVAPGYQLVIIAEMGISLELPNGWIDAEPSNPAEVRVFTDAGRSRYLTVIAAKVPGKDFTAALAEADTQSQTAYEGQASIRIEREDPLTIAGMPGALRHRELLAAGMRDLAAVFELEDRLFTVTLRREDGSNPTAEDEVLLRSVTASVKSVQ